MKIFKALFCPLVLLSAFFLQATAQKTIPLYQGRIPNSNNAANEEQANASHTVVSKVSVPTLSIYLPPPDSATGTAMIICPGGGYHNLVIGREGYKMATRLTHLGVAAFVLKYRLPSDRTMKNKTIGPLQDAQQAIRLVRMHATALGVDPHKVG